MKKRRINRTLAFMLAMLSFSNSANALKKSSVQMKESGSNYDKLTKNSKHIPSNKKPGSRKRTSFSRSKGLAIGCFCLLATYLWLHNDKENSENDEASVPEKNREERCFRFQKTQMQPSIKSFLGRLEEPPLLLSDYAQIREIAEILNIETEKLEINNIASKCFSEICRLNFLGATRNDGLPVFETNEEAFKSKLRELFTQFPKNSIVQTPNVIHAKEFEHDCFHLGCKAQTVRQHAAFVFKKILSKFESFNIDFTDKIFLSSNLAIPNNNLARSYEENCFFSGRDFFCKNQSIFDHILDEIRDFIKKNFNGYKVLGATKDGKLEFIDVETAMFGKYRNYDNRVKSSLKEDRKTAITMLKNIEKLRTTLDSLILEHKQALIDEFVENLSETPQSITDKLNKKAQSIYAITYTTPDGKKISDSKKGVPHILLLPNKQSEHSGECRITMVEGKRVYLDEVPKDVSYGSCCHHRISGAFAQCMRKLENLIVSCYSQNDYGVQLGNAVGSMVSVDVATEERDHGAQTMTTAAKISENCSILNSNDPNQSLTHDLKTSMVTKAAVRSNPVRILAEKFSGVDTSDSGDSYFAPILLEEDYNLTIPNSTLDSMFGNGFTEEIIKFLSFERKEDATPSSKMMKKMQEWAMRSKNPTGIPIYVIYYLMELGIFAEGIECAPDPKDEENRDACESSSYKLGKHLGNFRKQCGDNLSTVPEYSSFDNTKFEKIRVGMIKALLLLVAKGKIVIKKKLTAKQIRLIKKSIEESPFYLFENTVGTLAESFGISQEDIFEVLRNET